MSGEQRIPAPGTAVFTGGVLAPDPTTLTTEALNREIAGVQVALYREVDTLTAQRHRRGVLT